ncbi:MAG: LON peptidase substrate-binding domain-containing protein [Anaerolineae bacterium]|nr:LON peptidase substrate-binding domain-containing protein [Anaerolineae bacterium]MDW8173282.1 LON peptidase substrate-binding domain-containing protein [Anaerolineae bacterium]
MYELALFPLNTVLFPGMPLKLHIFEERYKLMINRCYDQQRPFGVVLIAEGQEALGPLAQPFSVGTTAHISQLQRLPFGRMNILAIGGDRFRIHELKHDQPYLVGLVEDIPMPQITAETLQKQGRSLRPLLERYLRILEQAQQVEFDASQIPTDPTNLTQLAVFILQTDMHRKQSLLESETPHGFIHDLITLYRSEIALLEIMSAPPHEDDAMGPFSAN